MRNIPAALYKAMGGFATNGVNMTKLESYMIDGQFTATQFYADIEGHPDDPPVARALEELAYFTTKLQILGVYPRNPFRRTREHVDEAEAPELATGWHFGRGVVAGRLQPCGAVGGDHRLAGVVVGEEALRRPWCARRACSRSSER